jgi:SAM-dependent methyltransferase
VTLLRRLAVGTTNRILDVGCGDGLFFARLREFGEVSGIEADPTLISPDSPHRNRIRIGTFGREFVPPVRYNLILMLDVLEHADDPLAMLRRARESLEANGLVVITVPALPQLWTSHDELNQHQKRYTKRDLLCLLGEAGLQAERCFYFFHWLVLPKLMLRWKEQWIGCRPAPPRIWPRPFNLLLEWLCLLEHPLSFWLPIPFGSSLLVAGRCSGQG